MNKYDNNSKSVTQSLKFSSKLWRGLCGYVKQITLNPRTEEFNVVVIRKGSAFDSVEQSHSSWTDADCNLLLTKEI